MTRLTDVPPDGLSADVVSLVLVLLMLGFLGISAPPVVDRCSGKSTHDAERNSPERSEHVVGLAVIRQRCASVCNEIYNVKGGVGTGRTAIETGRGESLGETRSLRGKSNPAALGDAVSLR